MLRHFTGCASPFKNPRQSADQESYANKKNLSPLSQLVFDPPLETATRETNAGVGNGRVNPPGKHGRVPSPRFNSRTVAQLRCVACGCEWQRLLQNINL
jgi:hypothetical protein